MSLFITKIQIEKTYSTKEFTNTDVEITYSIDEKTGKKLMHCNNRTYEVISSKRQTFAQMKEEHQKSKVYLPQ